MSKSLKDRIEQGEAAKFCECSGEKRDIATITQEQVGYDDEYCFDSDSDMALPLDFYYFDTGVGNGHPDVYIYGAQDVVVKISTSRSEIGQCIDYNNQPLSCMEWFPNVVFGGVSKVAIINPNGNKVFVESIGEDPSYALTGIDTEFVRYGSEETPADSSVAHIIADRQAIWPKLWEQMQSGAVKVEAVTYALDPVHGGSIGPWSTSSFPLLKYSYETPYGGSVISNVKHVLMLFDVEASVTYGKRKVTVTVGENTPLVVDATGDNDVQIDFEFGNKFSVTNDGLTDGNDVVGGVLDGSTSGSHITIGGTWPDVESNYDLWSSYGSGDRVITAQRHLSFSRSPPATLSGTNIPLSMDVDKLVLDAEMVSIQGDWSQYQDSVTLTHNETVFSIRNCQVYSLQSVEVIGGHLTLVQNVCSDGPLESSESMDVACRTIDGKYWAMPDRLPSGATLLENGKVEAAHGLLGIQNSYNTLDAYVRKNEHKWCEFKSEADIVAELWNDWKYVAAMLKSEGAKLAKAIKQDFGAKFLTLYNISYSGKPTIEVYRSEIPVYDFFSTDFDPIVCLKQDEKINVKDWTVTWNPSIFYAGERDFTKYAPQLKEYGVAGVIEKGTQDGYECIGYKLSKLPNSAFVVVVYMANQTLVDSLSFMSDIFTVVTPATIDQKVVLSNPSAKNVLLVCFDDIPSGKKINLWDMRVDSNLFVVGVPMRAVYDGTVFKAIQDGLKKEDLMGAFQPLLDKYKEFLPRVSLHIHNHDSIALIGCNYVGSSINCNILAALACNIGDAQLSAKYVYADSSTYDSLRSRTIDNLVLIPVSLSPPDYLSISSVEFEPGKWRLVGKGLYNSGEKDPIVKYEIETSRVGQLHIVSNTNDIEFKIPQGTKLTSAKGVSVVMGLNTDNMYTTLPEYPLLSDDASEHMSLLKSVTHHIRKFARQLSTRASEKSVKFTGEWSQVTEIQGSFSVDAGSEPIAVKDVPTNVVASLQVKSSEKSEVNLPADVEPIDLKIPLFEVAGAQSLSYGKGVNSVAFDNLTFMGGRLGSVIESSIAVSLSGVDQVVTAKHVNCLDYSSVEMATLQLSDSLEMGVGSTFQAPQKYDQNQLSLSLHYTIYSLANGHTPKFTSLQKVPKELRLIYDNDDMSFDMSPYVTKPLTLLTLTSEANCGEWQKVVKFTAENPNFQGDSGVMSAKCSGASLNLILKTVPEATPMPTIPEEPEDNPLNIGAIVGGVIGGIAVVALVAVAIVIVLRRKTLFNHNTSSSGDFSNEPASTTE